MIESENMEEDEEEVEEEPLKPKKMYTCDICGAQFDDPLVLGRHKRKEHPKPPPPEGYKCKLCDFVAKTPAELGRHMRYSHPKEEVEEEGKVAEPSKPISEMTEEELATMVALEGRSGLNKIKYERLKQVLDKHPKINSQARDWILWQWEVDEAIRDDPQKLIASITSAGVPEAVAYQVTSAVWQLENKYANILAQKQYYPYYMTPENKPPYYPPFQRPSQPQPSQPLPPIPQTAQPPQYWYPQTATQQPQYYWYPQTQTQQDNMLLQMILDRLNKLEEQKRQPPPSFHQEKEEMVTIQEPIWTPEGTILVDDTGNPVTTPITLPKSVAVQYLAMRRSQRGEGGVQIPPEISQFIESSKEKIQELEAQLKEQADRMQKQELEAIRKELSDTRATLNAIIGSIRSGDWRTDEGRLVGEGLRELVNVFREKEPVKEAIGLIRELSAKGAPPQPTAEEMKKQEEQALSAIEQELKRRQLIKE